MLDAHNHVPAYTPCLLLKDSYKSSVKYLGTDIQKKALDFQNQVLETKTRGKYNSGGKGLLPRSLKALCISL